MVMNPRGSFRKVLGVYEHELNDWLEAALTRVTRVLDVGANDGYFTFGCAAAFRRLGKKGEIVGFEPGEECVQALHKAVPINQMDHITFEVIQSFVGRQGENSLDALPPRLARQNTLIKINVEGAEVDVAEGAASWVHPTNLFLIEVHQEKFLPTLKRWFEDRGVKLRQINQAPLPLLGREKREATNWWLVSDLGQTTR